MNPLYFLYFVLFSLTFCSVLNESNASKWTRKLQTKWTNQTVYEFRDIEYGVCYTDHRKFLPSVERDSLKNSIDEISEHDKILRSLRLTIATKKLNTSQPVMVHIGSFDLQKSDFESVSPGFLLEKDIVLVSVEYRTGATGFLSMRNSNIPGNAGISDILLALKWIQSNISQYGGDPDRATLFGQYKAAGLIHVLMLSNLGVNLFRQVILQSGSALLSNFTTKYPVKYTRKVGVVLKCSDVIDKVKLTECIAHANAKDLEKAYREVWMKHKGNIPFVTIGGPSGVLNKYPMVIHRSEQVIAYPKIIGFVDQPSASFFDFFATKNEKRSFFSMKRFPDDASKMIRSASLMFGKSPLENILPNATSLAKLKNADPKRLKQAFDLVVTSVLDWSNLYVKSAIYYTGFLNKLPNTYAYAFKYVAEHHTLSNNEHFNAAIIQDDNQFLFDEWYDLNEEDTKVAKNMVDYWTSFAVTGKPRSTNGINWPEVVVGSDNYLIIDDALSVANDYIIEFQSTVQTYLTETDDILFNECKRCMA